MCRCLRIQPSLCRCPLLFPHFPHENAAKPHCKMVKRTPVACVCAPPWQNFIPIACGRWVVGLTRGSAAMHGAGEWECNTCVSFVSARRWVPRVTGGVFSGGESVCSRPFPTPQFALCTCLCDHGVTGLQPARAVAAVPAPLPPNGPQEGKAHCGVIVLRSSPLCSPDPRHSVWCGTRPSARYYGSTRSPLDSRRPTRCGHMGVPCVCGGVLCAACSVVAADLLVSVWWRCVLW